MNFFIFSVFVVIKLYNDIDIMNNMDKKLREEKDKANNIDCCMNQQEKIGSELLDYIGELNTEILYIKDLIRESYNEKKCINETVQQQKIKSKNMKKRIKEK